MLVQITVFLLDTLATFFVYLLLARFHMQWLRVSFRNQLGEFVVRTTNWIVRPARRVIPSVFGVDLASWGAAWLVQALALLGIYLLNGRDFSSAPGIATALIAGLSFADLVRYSLYMLGFALLMQAVLSWVNPNASLAPVFETFTRPFLRPLRRFIPPVANVDLSPLVLLIVVQVLLVPVAHVRGLLAGLL